MPELLLAIDCGTTSVRACLFSPEGALLGRSAAPIRSRSERPGQVEQDAGRIWRLTRTVIARALAEAGRSAADLAAVGVTSQRASLVVWDRRAGRPVSPMVVWSDLRGVERTRELGAAGFPLSPQQAAAKLEAVLAAFPETEALGRRRRLAWGNIDAFLTFKLTGGLHATDRSQAWPSGYLDLRTSRWNAALIEHQGLDPRLFPDLVDTWGPLGETSAEALGARVPLAAIVADQQSALIGQDGEAEGRCKISFGTSATLDVSTGGRFSYLGSGSAPFILSSVQGATAFCLEAMVYSAGSALDWARRVFGLGGLGALERLAGRAPDPCGAALLPALQGLGSPYAEATRLGALVGLGQSTGRADLARAALEGVAFRAREAFDHLYASSGLASPNTIPVDGGLSSSDLFLQLQADILAHPVERLAVRDAAASGAAICAARGVGLFAGAAPPAFFRRDRTFAPRWSEDEAAARLQAWRVKVYPEQQGGKAPRELGAHG